jgi:hypothetical protein
MALNSNQIAEILFKKVAAGKATTQLGRYYGNGEEGYSGRSFVDLTQIWVESNQIPIIAAPVANIVEHVIELSLINIPGSSSFTHPSLKNIIPFNYGDGISYSYILKTKAGVVIPIGVNDWYLDTETGVLTFFANDTSSTNDTGSFPTGVTTSNPPKLTCYKYIGRTAKDIGLIQTETTPIEVSMSTQDTFISETGLAHIASNISIPYAGIINTEYSVHINSVKLNDNQFDVVSLTLAPQVNAKLVKYITSDDTVWRVVKSGIAHKPVTGASNIQYYDYVIDEYPKKDGYVMVKNLPYELELGIDDLVINYQRVLG